MESLFQTKNSVLELGLSFREPVASLEERCGTLHGLQPAILAYQEGANPNLRLSL